MLDIWKLLKYKSHFMSEEKKIKTSVYLPHSVHWKLKEESVRRRMTDTAAMEEAITSWIGAPARATEPQLVVSNKNPWLRALSFIMASGDNDAISAVQQNIVIFFKHVGGNAAELPGVAAPTRGFLDPLKNKKGA